MVQLQYDVKNPSEYGIDIMHYDGNLAAWYDVCFFKRKKTINIVPKNPSLQEKYAQNLYRDIIKYVLGWSVDDAREHLSQYEIDKLDLLKVSDKCFSPDYTKSYRDKKENVLNLIYPGKCDNYEIHTIKELWKDVKAGKRKWPSKILGNRGNNRKAIFCLVEIFIQQNFIFSNISELYWKFSDSAKINNLLKKECLYDITKGFFNFPIDLLHEYLKMVDIERVNTHQDKEYIPENANDLLYMLYRCHCIAGDVKNNDETGKADEISEESDNPPYLEEKKKTG